MRRNLRQKQQEGHRVCDGARGLDMLRWRVADVAEGHDKARAGIRRGGREGGVVRGALIRRVSEKLAFHSISDVRRSSM